MSSHGDQALGHRMPLRRIDMQPIWRADSSVIPADPYVTGAERDRIWEITRQVAESA